MQILKWFDIFSSTLRMSDLIVNANYNNVPLGIVLSTYLEN